MNWGWLAAILGIAAGVGTAIALTSGGSGGGTSPPATTAPATPASPPSSPAAPPPAPPAPSTPLPTLVGPNVTTTVTGTTISWQDAGRGALGYTVDIDPDPTFSGGFWHKSVPLGTTTTSAPDGFVAYNGAT